MTTLQKSVFPLTNFPENKHLWTQSQADTCDSTSANIQMKALLSFSHRSINKAACTSSFTVQSDWMKPSLGDLGGGGFGHIGSHSGLVHSVQQVFGVHGQRVSGRQHLFLTLVLQRRDGVLLSQTHLTDQLGQILIQQLLSAFNLTNKQQFIMYRNIMDFSITEYKKIKVIITFYLAILRERVRIMRC